MIERVDRLKGGRWRCQIKHGLSGKTLPWIYVPMPSPLKPLAALKRSWSSSVLRCKNVVYISFLWNAMARESIWLNRDDLLIHKKSFQIVSSWENYLIIKLNMKIMKYVSTYGTRWIIKTHLSCPFSPSETVSWSRRCIPKGHPVFRWKAWLKRLIS